jgi:Holliday junction resolvase
MLPEVRKRINARNKTRSRQMEMRVARYLKGNRVPMSGSGSLKGDCFVPYDEYRTIYVECKLTEKGAFYIYQKWLEKMLRESNAMRCVFPILVIHFVGDSQNRDLVFIPESAVTWMENQTGHVLADQIESDGFSYEKDRIIIWNNRETRSPAYYKTLHGEWLLLYLFQFKEYLDRINNSE